MKIQFVLPNIFLCIGLAALLMAANPGFYREFLSYRYNKLGESYLRGKQFIEAQESFEKALEIDSDNPGFNYNLGLVELSSGNFSRAAGLFEKTTQRNPVYIDAYYNAGLCYRQLGNYEREAEQYEKLLKYDHTLAKAHYALALAYARLGKKQECINELELAIKYYPEGSEWQERCREILMQIKSQK